MKGSFVSRLGAALLGVALLVPAGAGAKDARAPMRVAAAPQVTIINGAPLQIHVGDDSSFQVFNAQVPGSGQIFPSASNDTADMGFFVRTADSTLYAPNFSEHPMGTATSGLGAYTAFTPVSLSGVSGAGTAASPFRVDVVGTLGASGITANLQVVYINGQNYFTKTLTLTNGNAPTSVDGGGSQNVSVFLGADIFLAASDTGVPFREPNSGSPGGQDCGTPPSYTILLIPLSAADAYSGRSYSTIWNEIGAGQLDNTSDPGCEDNGAALQWNRTIAQGGTTVIQAATSFGEIPGITQFNVSAVNPNSGGVGTSVNVTITGVGFLPGTTFTFGSGITVTQLAIVGGNTATATLVIDPAATAGPRDVTGTQSGAGSPTSTLISGFTVTNGGGGGEPSAGPIAAPAMSTLGLLMLAMALVAVGAFAGRRV
ncbi:MAG: hypothetical protein ABIR62_07845 [Dokdonella sp.]|uniref:hypothetical protein n=1 Tax=Dokdonella sp. TaxID=2291710 RepID=UPI0032662FB8